MTKLIIECVAFTLVAGLLAGSIPIAAGAVGINVSFSPTAILASVMASVFVVTRMKKFKDRRMEKQEAR